ncbi:inositol monophosphatase family protein [Saccharibacter floricola]|uniref:Inositol monophosphatase n=1 Tax=Saccharibacter floricola DSM 15669 TaxID=1123227 RepID=A0ABQ0P0E6_9PROT|nr:inositol monophosphatase family protein [Saccharibacter floricola]GBQ07695.1 inositol monophosphatase [Saccharibacter floricola DSM 15669]
MTQSSLAHYLTIAERCADIARQTVMPYFRSPLNVDSKGDDSPVTLADQQAEEKMRALLSDHFPQHSILGEEGGQNGTLDDEWLWVLDPIDGTRAFVTGRPTFCTLIALLHRGKPVLGVIDQPATEERWTGIEGQKTRYHSARFPGKINPRACPSLSEAELSCTAPEIIRPIMRPAFERLQAATRRTSWGGDAYAFGLLTLGSIDLITEDTMKPWDWAALVPVVQGAGGSMTDWHGNPLRLEGDGSVLACGNPALLSDVIRTLS